MTSPGERAERSRRAQGLSVRIDDPVALARIARIFRPSRGTPRTSNTNEARQERASKSS